MEISDKHFTCDAKGNAYRTGPIIWGGHVFNGQRLLYQLLPQGTQMKHCDSIGFYYAVNSLPEHHNLHISNLLAQSEALVFGKPVEEVTAEGAITCLVLHCVCEGSRLSSALLTVRLTPTTLVQSIALSGYGVSIQGSIRDINMFDQSGVELGEVLSKQPAHELESQEEPFRTLHSSNDAPVHRYRRIRGGRL